MENIRELDRYKSDIKLLNNLDNKNVHNFSLGVLDTYFHINKAVIKRKIMLLNKRILFCYYGKPKTFVYAFDEEKDLSLLKLLQTKSLIYSIIKLPLNNQSVFTEIAYNLHLVFNRLSYLNAKKRYQRLSYPFKFLERNNIKCYRLQDVDFRQVQELHEKWVEHKMNDSKVYRIMFPRARYLNCCRKAIPNSLSVIDSFKPRYIGYAFMQRNKLIIVRVIHICGSTAYDLAFFGNTWDSLSQVVNYSNTYVLRELYQSGIDIVNCGVSLNKYLESFKTHFPSFKIVSFRYGRKQSKQQKLKVSTISQF